MDQIYNAGEAGLNFKMLPCKKLAVRNEPNVPGAKKNKERLTILTYTNTAGTHRLPLMVIGKSAKPRALNKIPQNQLPVFYKNQKCTWMRSDLFKLWFDEQFVSKVKEFVCSKGLPEKVLLLLDNAPLHPDEKILQCGEITTMCFPGNVTG